MSKHRVVITGIGVVAPNGVGKENFKNALENGISGIEHIQELKEIGMSSHIGGVPKLDKILINKYIPTHINNRIETSCLRYGVIAGLEAWEHANLSINKDVDWDSGVIMGMQTVDGTLAKNIVEKIFSTKKIRELSGRTAEQSITSCVSAYLSGYLGIGNCSVSNSSACATGTEAILMGYTKIKNGEAQRILAGSSEGNSPFIWSTLDRIRALNTQSNNSPQKASSPMSADAKGLVPGCGSGALVLESLESALNRNAHIYAEIIGGANNCGAQRNGGTMTKPNIEGIKRCIKSALTSSKIESEDIDLISGHLTATYADPVEIQAWTEVLKLNKQNFPHINSVKSMTGHCLAAAGAIESVAVVLQIYNQFVHPSINCENIHPDILKNLLPERIPQKTVKKKITHVAKANFGFGDVNSCLIFKAYENEK